MQDAVTIVYPTSNKGMYRDVGRVFSVAMMMMMMMIVFDDNAVVCCYRGLMLGYYKWLIHLLWQVFARGLIERGSAGAIVNISSQASQRALTNHIVYCMSKSAVDQLTRCLAFELGPHKVTLLQILANNYTINRFSLIE